MRTHGCAAALVAVVAWLLTPATAGAFDISGFSVTPSSTQAGGHPDLSASITRSGTDNEDIRDLTIDLPPGVVGNPEAVQKCSRAAFMADACPAASQVGTAETIAAAVGLALPPVPGTVYVIDPDPDEAAALGIVLRPPASDLGTISKVFLVNSVTAHKLANGDYALRNLSVNLPRQIFLLGLIPIDITVNSLTLTLNSPGAAPGSYFMTNTTSCQPQVATVTAVDYNNQSATRDAPYQGTGCDQVPFTPSAEATWSATRAGSLSSPTVTLSLPADEDPLHQSHVKSAVVRFPLGVSLDTLAALAVGVCSLTELEADACPSNSDIADASVRVPPLPPDFTGDIFRVPAQSGETYGLGMVLRGPRGLKAVIRGFSELQDGRVLVRFPFQPQIPFTEFKLAMTRPILRLPQTCGESVTNAELVGHSGATASMSDSFTVTGCEHPASADVLDVSLVPAFRQTINTSQCSARGGTPSTHGAPLAFASCNPPGYAPGTGARQGPSSVGSAQFVVIPGDEEGNEPDVAIALNATDIRSRLDDSDYSPNPDGPDVTLVPKLRITDFFNGPNNDQGTTVDFDYPVQAECAPTADPSVGSVCNVLTSANILQFGTAQAGNDTMVQVFRVRLNDSGADGEPGGSDDRIFAQQGIAIR